MGKPLTKIEETISLAYVTAVVGVSGNSLNIVSEDYGVDVSIRRVKDYEGKKIDVGPIFECQLKATINWEEEKDHIVYDMEADAFNKIVFQNAESSVPVYLVLLCLPRNQSDWVTFSTESLHLRKCCFYQLIEGEKTKNSSSVRVRIPKGNIFSPDSIDEIIQEVE